VGGAEKDGEDHSSDNRDQIAFSLDEKPRCLEIMAHDFKVPSAPRYRAVFRRLSIRGEEMAKICGVSIMSLYSYLDVFPRDPETFSKIPAEVLEAFLLLRCKNIYFYTSPPNHSVPWLWILANVFVADSLANLLDAYRDLGIKTYSIKVILDAGVDKYWRKPCSELPVDYDNSYWNVFWTSVDRIKSLAKEFGFFYEVTVPDYVDDYSSAWGGKHCLWIDNYTNIDRTLDNVFYILSQDKSVPWLLPAQGYEDVPQSILKAIEVYMESRLHKKYRIGLANLCTSKKASLIVKTIQLARELCNDCRYHVFGPSLTAIKKSIALSYLQPGDSWDSTAWTYPRGSGWSAKTADERIQYFLFYLRHIVDGFVGGGDA
jgi:hypothetical protein